MRVLAGTVMASESELRTLRCPRSFTPSGDAANKAATKRGGD